MRHTVVLTSMLPEIATTLLSRDFDIVAHDAGRPRSEDELIEILSEADAAVTLLTDRLSRRVLESNPNLRIVANYAVGTDNIDLQAARDQKVTITNTPGVLTEATAELTWALILALVRRLLEGDAMLRRGEYTGWHPLLLLASTLRGKQLGIVGMGRIGSAVAARAEVFGMKVAYTSRRRHEDAEKMFGASAMTFEELLATSNVVSLHMPLTAETRHTIDAAALTRMKRGSYLINTARGPLVDEAALADALESGHLRGAGLDVYEREPLVEPRLLKLPNAILLPHLGSATEETRSDMARIVAMDVIAYFRGQRPANVVV